MIRLCADGSARSIRADATVAQRDCDGDED